ncbi:MAG: hypothetical protein AAF718_08650 [Pseudomonadota bacterium]
MARVPFKTSGGITVTEDAYGDLESAIARAIEKLDAVEIDDGFSGPRGGRGQGQGQRGGAPLRDLRGGFTERYGPVRHRSDDIDPVALNQQLNQLMMQAGALCEYGDPPQKEIDAVKRPGRPLHFKCRHSPPHYFDKNGNDIDRP